MKWIYTKFVGMGSTGQAQIIKNFKTRTFKSTYEIDWENHKVKLLGTKETENNK